MKKAFRDGLELWFNGESFITPDGIVVEIFYASENGGQKTFFVELPGAPTCAHGATLEEAIEAAREKRGEVEPLSAEELAQYRAEHFKFNVRIFRKLTRACASGVQHWLNQRGLDLSATMTLREIRDAGAGEWADKLEEVIEQSPVKTARSTDAKND